MLLQWTCPPATETLGRPTCIGQLPAPSRGVARRQEMRLLAAPLLQEQRADRRLQKQAQSKIGRTLHQRLSCPAPVMVPPLAVQQQELTCQKRTAARGQHQQRMCLLRGRTPMPLGSCQQSVTAGQQHHGMPGCLRGCIPTPLRSCQLNLAAKGQLQE